MFLGGACVMGAVLPKDYLKKMHSVSLLVNLKGNFGLFLVKGGVESGLTRYFLVSPK